MLIKILIILAIAMQFFEMGMLTHLMLTPKKSLKMCVLAWTLFAVFGGMIRTYLYDGAIIQVIGLAVMTYLWISIMKFCYREPFWKRIAAMCFLYAVAMIGEIIIALFIMANGTLDFDVNGFSYERLFVLLLATFALAVAAIFSLRVWRLLTHFDKAPGMSVVLLQFLFQIFMLVGAEYPIWGLNISVFGRSVYCEIGEIIGCIGLLYWVWWMAARSHQRVLEESIKDLELELKAEHDRYHATQQKREALAKLRHDMNNQILAARYLIESGDEKEAEALLGQLAGALESVGPVGSE